MPVYPLIWQGVERHGAYPHLAKHDAVIWERFLDQYAGNFTTLSYDVAFGGFLIDEQLEDDALRLGWQYSTALKVDVVAARETDVWIIEVKPHAGVSAIGAALCYVAMAEADGFTPWPLIPAVVTDRASADIRFCASRYGVTLVEVPEP